MASFNQVILMGNVTRDPQMRLLPSQTAVVDFGLACDRRYRTAQGEDREEVCYVDCSAFGKQAQVINQYCRKGKPLFIQGRLRYDTWEDKQGGGKRSKLSVIVENFQFIGSRDGSGSFPGAAAEAQKREPDPDRAGRHRTAGGRGAGAEDAEPTYEQEDIPF